MSSYRDPEFYNLEDLKKQISSDPFGVPKYTFEWYEEMSCQTKDLEQSAPLIANGDQLVLEIKALSEKECHEFKNTFAYILTSLDQSQEFVNKQYDLLHDWYEKHRYASWSEKDDQLYEICQQLDLMNRELRPPIVPSELQQIIITYALDTWVLSMPNVCLTCRNWHTIGSAFAEKYKDAITSRQEAINQQYKTALQIMKDLRVYESHFEGKFKKNLKNELGIIDCISPKYELYWLLQSVISECITYEGMWGELKIKNLDGMFGGYDDNPEDRSSEVMDLFKLHYPNFDEWRIAYFTFSEALGSMCERYNQNNMRSILFMDSDDDASDNDE